MTGIMHDLMLPEALLTLPHLSGPYSAIKHRADRPAPIYREKTIRYWEPLTFIHRKGKSLWYFRTYDEKGIRRACSARIGHASYMLGSDDFL
jgi:hypothetical protein